jgi:hypothetical protein
MRRLPRLLLLLAVGALALLVAAPVGATADRDDRSSKEWGVFRTLPAGTEMGLRIKGFAVITRSSQGTNVYALAWGLDPRTTYPAHLHNAPCSASPPGGGHYMNVPGALAEPPNELWLSSTADPKAGMTTNALGIAFGRGSADWVARPEAQAVVIHAPTEGAPRLACADMR